MSSSGLIYAVIVGAWAAYLVPMWLRRQDELNEERPTERFSTAIRLLSGRGAMERRFTKAKPEPEHRPTDDTDPIDETVDVRGLAVPVTEVKPVAAAHGQAHGQVHAQAHGPAHGQVHGQAHGQAHGQVHGQVHGGRPTASADRSGRQRLAVARNPRAKVLARRRRTTTVLFLVFTAGAVVAAVCGLAFLWVPVLPAILLTVYIGHLRRQEHRRFEVKIDKRRAAEAARHLRERVPAGEVPGPAVPEAEPAPSPRTAGRRALVEQTDHAEWVDQQREQRAPADDDGWEPAPVPLPTYVNAPVAPRTTDGIDLASPGTWSSARSGTSLDPDLDAERLPPAVSSPVRRPRDRPGTPLFDQYAERPRAANE